METIRIGDDRLKIMLSREDMMRYELDSDALNGESEASCLALRRILRDAGETVGFDTSPGRLYVQIYEAGMGCEMFVTQLPRELTEETEQGTRHFFFADSSALIAYCQRQKEGAPSTTLFWLGQGLLLGFSSDCPKNVYDYGEPLDESACRYIEEYAIPILEKNAVACLGSLFS